ncbi:MAG: hypothetical protein QOG49_1406 [Frankiaceae bacterium]|nr:hypothetical protein [Frankiaceae bacterium]
MRQFAAAVGDVVEESATGFTGEIIDLAKDAVTLLGRGDKVRVFPLLPAGFLVDGEPVTLVRPAAAAAPVRRTASGSVASAPSARARVARAGRIYVEGKHDAELVEKVWGDDLRSEGIVVEGLDGIDDLVEVVRSFAPAADARLGVLVDHLVAGSKESRIVAGVSDPHVLVLGHPYVDVWQAVKPAVVGIDAWPVIARGTDWKQGICDALGVADPPTMWRRILRSVSTYADLEVPLLQSVEHLIDFVTAQP